MDSLETASALFIDNFLDFSSDIGEEDDDSTVANLADHDSFPAFAEEELEWLSNRDAFPPIESFDVLSTKTDNAAKNQSPVSVLENSGGGIRVPVQARSKRRRRRSFADLSGQQWWFCYDKKRSVGGTRVSRTSTISGRRCLHCQSEKTPQWRAGPLGPKTLCNACGVRYKSGRLVPEYRPASSPTFSDELHSNSHRKILDMRRQKEKEPYLQPSDKGSNAFLPSKNVYWIFLNQYHSRVQEGSGQLCWQSSLCMVFS